MVSNTINFISFYIPVTQTLAADQCPQGQPSKPLDVEAKGGEVGLFSDLTAEEIDGVLEYMYGKSGINVVEYMNATLTDTFIYVIEVGGAEKYGREMGVEGEGWGQEGWMEGGGRRRGRTEGEEGKKGRGV